MKSKKEVAKDIVNTIIKHCMRKIILTGCLALSAVYVRGHRNSKANITIVSNRVGNSVNPSVFRTCKQHLIISWITVNGREIIFSPMSGSNVISCLTWKHPAIPIPIMPILRYRQQDPFTILHIFLHYQLPRWKYHVQICGIPTTGVQWKQGIGFDGLASNLYRCNGLLCLYDTRLWLWFFFAPWRWTIFSKSAEYR